MTKKPAPRKRTKLDREVDAGLSAIDRALAKRMKPSRPAREVKPKPEPRPLFTYAEHLRVGDVIEVHGSKPIGNGNWQNTRCLGPVVSIDRETKRLYSRIDIVVRNTDWPDEPPEEFTFNKMEYVKLVQDGV